MPTTKEQAFTRQNIAGELPDTVLFYLAPQKTGNTGFPRNNGNEVMLPIAPKKGNFRTFAKILERTKTVGTKMAGDENPGFTSPIPSGFEQTIKSNVAEPGIILVLMAGISSANGTISVRLGNEILPNNFGSVVIDGTKIAITTDRGNERSIEHGITVAPNQFYVFGGWWDLNQQTFGNSIVSSVEPPVVVITNSAGETLPSAHSVTLQDTWAAGTAGADNDTALSAFLVVKLPRIPTERQLQEQVDSWFAGDSVLLPSLYEV